MSNLIFNKIINDKLTLNNLVESSIKYRYTTIRNCIPILILTEFIEEDYCQKNSIVDKNSDKI